jgi:hypothetical protein
MFRKTVTLMGAVALLLTLVVGCSDDEKKTVNNPPAANTAIDLVDMGALIEAVAPPEFTAPTAIPDGADSIGIWTDGDYPLLEKVFGSQDPQALYSNINSFKNSYGIITATMEVDANGDIVTGTYIDSAYGEKWDGLGWMHFTVVVTALTDSTVIPTAMQEVMGAKMDIDYLLDIDLEELTGETILIGITLTDTEQTLMQYDVGAGDPNDTESRLIYASLDPTDSSFVFKGVGYCEHQDGQKFTYAFNINSTATSDFAYRMSYYSNGSIENDLLNCIVGGGNKDEEFALSYRMFIPADTTVCDSSYMFDQVFGPNYSEGTGLISAYDEYLNPDLLFGYDVVPQEMLTNPWE